MLLPLQYTHISPEDMNMNVYWSNLTWRHIFCMTEAVSFWICYKQSLYPSCLTNAPLVWSGLNLDHFPLERCPVPLWQCKWFRHFLFHWVLIWDGADHVSFAMEKTFCTCGAALALQNQHCHCGSSSPL